MGLWDYGTMGLWDNQPQTTNNYPEMKSMLPIR